MYAISLFSRFIHYSNIAHYKVAKRVLRYVKGTLSFGIKFIRTNKKQQSIAQSTAEAEYVVEDQLGEILTKPLGTTRFENLRNDIGVCKWRPRRSATQVEYDALIQNQTWTLIPLPSNRKPIGCRNPYGFVAQYKRRLVAKDTLIPVVKPVTIQTALSVVVTKKWHLRQVDMNNAFLNGVFYEEIYMEQPLGYVQKRRTTTYLQALEGTILKDFLLFMGF
ncbi:Retrovirus-related Pol polyprotein from transposon TNT 1-94 [Gossypium australe]|uniref:Retrovirus-related Pol polyprotein from transposon TNT 1-94 n=1 Tax=Gossypium australe TaxID=47621 RepID=A0A5B6WYP9_9ROSI|nr:Retrovirus-related Pol polyprotein from transposon TNT 1-94 [Gossypium australe]